MFFLSVFDYSTLFLLEPFDLTEGETPINTNSKNLDVHCTMYINVQLTYIIFRVLTKQVLTKYFTKPKYLYGVLRNTKLVKSRDSLILS